MPCSYKSSVGRRLSRLLQLPHIDTDIEIENSTNATIVELLARGEDVFRCHESTVIANLPQTPCVISTGGGVVEIESNMAQLKANSTIVWLSTRAETVYHRLNNSNNPRPLATHLTQAQLADYVQRRDSLYRQYADITIATDHATSHGIASKLHAMLTNKAK